MEAFDTFFYSYRRKIKRFLLSYSRVIVMLKVWLFSLAALCLGAFFVYPQLVEQQKLFNISISSDIINEAQSIKITNIRFFGVDDRNSPYVITSAMAEEKNAGSKIIHMDKPMADIISNDGEAINITSDNGIIDQKQNILTLQDKVAVFSSEGYEVFSDKLNFNMKTNVIFTDVEINARGDFGTLIAEGIEVVEKGNKINFKGKTVINLFER